MGIDKESDVSANLQIGPTSVGMVRIYVEGDGIDLPLDFDPDEALEIAEEIRVAAEKARLMGPKAPPRKGPKPPKSGDRPGGPGQAKAPRR